VERFGDYVAEQTLATELNLAAETGDGFRYPARLGDREVEIGIARQS
jgi:hypothetical protein